MNEHFDDWASRNIMVKTFPCVKLKATLGKNEYPGKLIDNQIHKYLHNKDNTKVEIDESEKKIKYFKLPFIGSMSLYAQKKLNDIIKRFCKVENVKLVFTTCKLSSFFSLKDRVPFELQTFVGIQICL